METAKDKAETISMRPMESKLPNPLTIGANGCANETDGSRNHPGTLNMRTHTITPANKAGNISMHPNKPKTRNSPSGAAKQHSHELNSFGDTTNPSSGRRDNHSVGNIMGTVANETEIIRTRRNSAKTQNSPNGHKIATPRSACRWRRVSIDVINIYVPLNAPIVVPSRKFIFGQVEGGDEHMAARELEERAGNGEGDQNESDGDVDGTTNGGSVNSIRVEAARLATENQHIRYSRRTQDQDLPVSSGPPTYCAEHPNEPVKH